MFKIKKNQKNHQIVSHLLFATFVAIVISTFISYKVYAYQRTNYVRKNAVLNFAETPKIEEIKIDNTSDTRDVCGAGDNKVKTTIDIGCKGLGNPILDALFAIIRFLTLGAGLIMIGSMIVAGIQYSTSRGDPQATAAAIKRITATFIALLLFLFIYAISNWLVPAGILK